MPADSKTRTIMAHRKLAKTCDECKNRKIRCQYSRTVGPESQALVCKNCQKRDLSCRFSFRKQRVKRMQLDTQSDVNEDSTPPTAAAPAHSATWSDVQGAERLRGDSALNAPGTLLVDVLLDTRPERETCVNGNSLVKTQENYVGSSGIAFFSEQRIGSISSRLGHPRFQNLLRKVEDTINTRMDRNKSGSSESLMKRDPLSTEVPVSKHSSRSFINAFFEHIHPIFPFLDRQSFEDKAFDEQCQKFCEEDHPFSALYHTVLALGCQYHGGGSFRSGLGMAWKLFNVAFNLLPEILTRSGTLVHAQAVTAMAIMAHNSACLDLGYFLTTEAARMAQYLGIGRKVYRDDNPLTCQRTFWVIYILEKTLSFTCGRDSALNDANVSTTVPHIPESIIDGLVWFHTMCRFSRLLSRMQSTLFNISSSLLPPASLQSITDAFSLDLERWRQPINDWFRPGHSFQTFCAAESKAMSVKLRVQYHYYGALIALARVRLRTSQNEAIHNRLDSENRLLGASRTVIELTRYIDVEPYIPNWILLSLPLSALFILFDFTIHHPFHEQTKANLALLGVVSGYFCRLEYATGGSLQTSGLSELAHIAWQYISELESGSISQTTGETPALPYSQSDGAPVVWTPPDTLQVQEHAAGGVCANIERDDPTEGDSFSLDKWSDGVDLADLFAATFPHADSQLDTNYFNFEPQYGHHP
ncbi:hypothetical protein BJX65DRAFT_24554 [Aspergillus insuetus]